MKEETAKAQIRFIRDCLHAVNIGNIKEVSEIALETLTRLENNIFGEKLKEE